MGKILSRAELVAALRPRRAAGEKIVFTNGCYDLVHPGHVTLLERARGRGDILVVGVNSDRSVRELKGDSRPILPQNERAEVMAALAAVDYVSIFDEPTPAEIVAAIKPDVLIKGADWGTYIVGRDTVEAGGGEVISAELEPGWSTSKIVETIRARFGRK